MPQVSLTAMVEGIRAGKIVSFPTDTVPALAALPMRSPLIFAAKGRSAKKPLILMGASTAQLWEFVAGSQREAEIWEEIAEKYWPGALTMVLPASDRVPKVMNPGDHSTIGLRIPNHPIALKILGQTGALATTSANISGKPPLKTMAEINNEFVDVLTLLDREFTDSAVGIPSTVIKWTENKWEILRQGAVKFEE